MKLDIFSHCAIDTICINDTNHIVPGGAACYCSLMAKTLKFDVILHTKFGPDFSLFDYLSKKKILIFLFPSRNNAHKVNDPLRRIDHF